MNDYSDQREHNHGARVVAGPVMGQLRGAQMKQQPNPPTSSIAGRMESLSGRIDEAEKAFAALHEAIAPVLRQTPERESSGVETSDAARSDLALALAYANDRVDRLICRINLVRSAVDL